MIVILGAGISGLSFAHCLKKQGKDFILLESANKVGGIVQTEKKDKFLCELGPNTVLINNPEIKLLLEDLGLLKSTLQPDEGAINNRFVLKNGQAEPFPSSLKKAIKSKLMSWSTLFHVLKEPFKPSYNGEQEESLADFCKRRFGQQILDDFFTPFVTGIYAGNPEKMSINYTMNMLKEAEEKHGSVMKGMFKMLKEKKQSNQRLGLPKQKIFSFKNGLNELTSTIYNELKEHIRLNCRVNKIERESEGYLIHYQDNESSKTLKASKIISSIPAYALADLIQPFGQKLAEQLLKINYVSAISMHFSIEKNSIDFKSPAFGILSRAAESVHFLGILFNSRFFHHTSEDSERELITVITGGSRYPEMIRKQKSDLEAEITSDLKATLGLSEKPKLLSVRKWENGIPQYELGHGAILESVEQFSSAHPNFHIIGNFLHGISVSDCIRNSFTLAKNKF